MMPVPGYARRRVGRTRLVALEACAPELEQILAGQPLHEYAAAQPDARALRGRGPVYAVRLPGECGRVVVRHALRGGLVGQFMHDLYLSRLRPWRELLASCRLRALGVPTPEIVAYAVYPAGVFIRYDMITREIEDSADLAGWLTRASDPIVRSALFAATTHLLEALAEAGAHHPDLNAKNVLLVPDQTGFRAFVLDVDRVRFHVSRLPMIMEANRERLQRSLRKLQRLGLTVDEAEIASLASPGPP